MRATGGVRGNVRGGVRGELRGGVRGGVRGGFRGISVGGETSVSPLIMTDVLKKSGERKTMKMS